MPKTSKPLNIKDPEVYRLARALADRSRTTMTQVVLVALREKLEREERRRHARDLVEEMKEIAARLNKYPVRDHRSGDEIIGYNESGAFD